MARGMSPQTGAGIGLNLGSLIGSLMQQSDAKKQEEQLKLDQNGFYSELAQNAPQWGQMSPSEYSATLLATLNKHNLTPGPVFEKLIASHSEAWKEQQKNKPLSADDIATAMGRKPQKATPTPTPAVQQPYQPPVAPVGTMPEQIMDATGIMEELIAQPTALSEIQNRLRATPVAEPVDPIDAAFEEDIATLASMYSNDSEGFKKAAAARKNEYRKAEREYQKERAKEPPLEQQARLAAFEGTPYQQAVAGGMKPEEAKAVYGAPPGAEKYPNVEIYKSILAAKEQDGTITPTELAQKAYFDLRDLGAAPTVVKLKRWAAVYEGQGLATEAQSLRNYAEDIKAQAERSAQAIGTSTEPVFLADGSQAIGIVDRITGQVQYVRVAPSAAGTPGSAPAGAPAISAPPLASGERSKAQERVVALTKTSKKLEALADNTDDKFLQKIPRALNWFSAAKEQAGFELNTEQKADLYDYTQWQTTVQQVFNDYRQAITGATAAVAELDKLEKAYVNGDLSPTEFRARLKIVQDMAANELGMAREMAVGQMPSNTAAPAQPSGQQAPAQQRARPRSPFTGK